MNDQFQQARQMFPNIPEEIFTLWFDDRIESNGWPPNTPVWNRALRDKDISFWAILKWAKKEISSKD